MRSKIIVIEGTDGSGKATQTKILRDKLISIGKKVFTTSFPNYESDSSAAVKMYLDGKIGSGESANDIKEKPASLFYAIDRYITYKNKIEPYYEDGNHVIVFDRYTGSNIIHQGAKIVQSAKKDDIDEKLSDFVKWLDSVEHEDLGIPRADITIYLRVPVEYTQKLREGRKNKINNGDKQDIHESDNNHLLNASISGSIAAEKLGWNVIECVKDGNMRSMEDIAGEIWNIVSKNI